MADKGVCVRLISWKLDNLIDHFKENGIDESALPLLDEDTIKELIPKIGERLKFIRQWRAERKSRTCHFSFYPFYSRDVVEEKQHAHVKSFIDFVPDVTPVKDYCRQISEKDRPQPFILTLAANFTTASVRHH
ncbi:hypothetical protein HOLleu_15992 [Holothuria leucospilota]|uniref:Uncharacterized protein n=1 Tax=Holothuria leucospilota TaxID=206669 RepID=A0A9Q1C600_HOLLE|nr:hypothetical protein HOLleu_15992 [Holothuria leucospilota]